MTVQPEGVDTRRALANAVASECARGGWRVESQTEVNAILAKGKRTSHGLHIFLSIITAGFWLPVWAIMWFMNREQRLILGVDEYGNITRSEA
jgi:hypothetical protein